MRIWGYNIVNPVGHRTDSFQHSIRREIFMLSVSPWTSVWTFKQNLDKVLCLITIECKFLCAYTNLNTQFKKGAIIYTLRAVHVQIFNRAISVKCTYGKSHPFVFEFKDRGQNNNLNFRIKIFALSGKVMTGKLKFKVTTRLTRKKSGFQN